jgi:hypothetical protein
MVERAAMHGLNKGTNLPFDVVAGRQVRGAQSTRRPTRALLGTQGVWERVFKILLDDPDLEYVLLDATHIRVHQQWNLRKGGLAIRPLTNRALV